MLNGEVMTVEPGPSPDTVYVGGNFSSVNGVTRKLVLLSTTSGQTVTSFTAPSMNGMVRDVVVAGARLYVGGAFTTAGGQPHGGLVALNATSGARQTFVNVALTENHNYTGQPGQSRGAVGAKAIAIDPDATTLAVVGNFQKADGLDRDQVALIDLTGATAPGRPDWRTARYEPACFSGAFDSYIRDVDFSAGRHLLRDRRAPAARAPARSATPRPAGRPTPPAPTSSRPGSTTPAATRCCRSRSPAPAVYVGGHQRWMNNSLRLATRRPPGAVPRPGLAALDPANGCRSPGTRAATRAAPARTRCTRPPTGLWVGSDTDWIGNRSTGVADRVLPARRRRGPALDTGGAPGERVPGGDGAVDGPVEHPLPGQRRRPGVAASDGGPDWLADEGSSSPYRNTGNNAAGWSPVAQIGPGVPAGRPRSSSTRSGGTRAAARRRRDGVGDPVPAGEELTVRLYFANRYDGTSTWVAGSSTSSSRARPC